MVADSNIWTASHVLYNKATASNPAETFYALFLVNHNTTTNQTNWIYSDFSAGFAL